METPRDCAISLLAHGKQTPVLLRFHLGIWALRSVPGNYDTAGDFRDEKLMAHSHGTVVEVHKILSLAFRKPYSPEDALLFQAAKCSGNTDRLLGTRTPCFIYRACRLDEKLIDGASLMSSTASRKQEVTNAGAWPDPSRQQLPTMPAQVKEPDR